MYYRVKTEAGMRTKASWGRAGHVTGLARIAKGHNRSQRDCEGRFLGGCVVTEVDRKAHNNCHIYTHWVFSLVKSPRISDKEEISTALQEAQWSPL